MKILELVVEVVSKVDKAVNGLNTVEAKFDRTTGMATKFDQRLLSIGSTALATGDNLSLLGARMAKISAASAVLFAGGFLFLRRATEEASNLEESINAVNVVFGEGADEILEFSADSARAVGLATSEYNQLSTAIGALLTATGRPIEEVTDMTIELTKRAADLASVHNTDVRDALTAINAALRGETEPIRRYAADVTDASLKAFLLSKGINKSVTSLSQQEKVLLRMELLLKQTAVVQGDFNNTIDNAANKARVNAAEYKDLAANIGRRLLPLKAALLEQVNQLLTGFNDLSPATQDLIVKFVALAVGLAGIVALVAPVLFVLGRLISLFGSLAQAIALINVATRGGSLIKFLAFFRRNKALAGTIRTLTGTFKILRFVIAALTGPIGLAIAAFTALFLIGEDLWTFFQGGQSVIGTLIDAFKDFDLLNTIGGWFQSLLDKAMMVLSGIWQSFSENFPQSAAAAEALGASMSNLASNISGIIFSTIALALANISQKFRDFRDIVGGVITNIMDWWSTMVELITGSPIFQAISDVSDFVGNSIDSGIDKAKELGTDFKNFLKSGFDNVLSSSLQLANVPIAQAANATNNFNVGDISIQVSGADANGTQIADDFVDRLNQRSNNVLHAAGGSSTN